MTSDLFVALPAGGTFLIVGAFQDGILAEALFDVQDGLGQILFFLLIDLFFFQFFLLFVGILKERKLLDPFLSFHGRLGDNSARRDVEATDQKTGIDGGIIDRDDGVRDDLHGRGRRL